MAARADCGLALEFILAWLMKGEPVTLVRDGVAASPSSFNRKTPGPDRRGSRADPGGRPGGG